MTGDEIVTVIVGGCGGLGVGLSVGSPSMYSLQTNKNRKSHYFWGKFTEVLRICLILTIVQCFFNMKGLYPNQ